MSKIIRVLGIFILFFLFIFIKDRGKNEQNQCNSYINEIKIGIMFLRMKDSGIGKQTSLLLKELSKVQFLKLYLLSREKEKGEYYIPKNIIRLIVYDNFGGLNFPKFVEEIISHKYSYLSRL